MGLNHDFLLLDSTANLHWKSPRVFEHPDTVHLHDDLLRYMQDTLLWIPTTNPARDEPHSGLCMWGPTIIDVAGAKIAERVFRGWAELFSQGPVRLVLTGSFSYQAEPDRSTDSAKETVLEGGYERLEFERDEVVSVLRQLAEWCGKVRDGEGRFYLCHMGI